MLQKLFAVILFSFFFSLFSIPIKDTDLGWHLRCGEQLLKTGRLCQTNSFTVLLEGYGWSSPNHLYDLSLAFIFGLFGFPGLAIFYGLLSALVLTLFSLSFRSNQLASLIILLASLAFSWQTLSFGFRSQILSLYFLTFFLTVLNLAQKRPRLLWLLPIINLIWANAHPGFFLGPLLIIFYLSQNLLETRRLNKPILILVLASLAATILNPFGYRIYLEAWQHAQTPLNRLIAEWVAPLPGQIFFILLLGIISFSALLKQKPINLFHLLVLALTSLLAISARRNLPLFAVSLTWILGNFPPVNSLQKRKTSLGLLIGIVGLTGYFAFNNLPRALSYDYKNYCSEALVPLPCGAVNFLAQQKTGRIFNTYEWGGFLVWQLPEFKFFVDGRMPTWNSQNEARLPAQWRGQSPYTIYLWALQTQPGWDLVLKNYRLDYLLFQPNTFLDLLLIGKEKLYGWQKIYHDGTAVIYEKI